MFILIHIYFHWKFQYEILLIVSTVVKNCFFLKKKIKLNSFIGNNLLQNALPLAQKFFFYNIKYIVLCFVIQTSSLYIRNIIYELSRWNIY